MLLETKILVLLGELIAWDGVFLFESLCFVCLWYHTFIYDFLKKQYSVAVKNKASRGLGVIMVALLTPKQNV